MFLYIPDGHQNRANDHKPFPGLGVFKQYFDPGFKSTPVRLSARNVERSINTIAHNLVSSWTFNRKSVHSLMSSRNHIVSDPSSRSISPIRRACNRNLYQLVTRRGVSDLNHELLRDPL